jgi:hypothetical protein
LLGNLSLVSSKFHASTVHKNFALPRSWVEPDFQLTPTFLYLRRLDLSSSLKGDEQVSQLAHSSAFLWLTFLKLKHCGIGNEGARDLIMSPWLKNLQIIILSKNSITRLPFEELKNATKTELRRELMEPLVLDVRENPLVSARLPKTLKSTVIFAWDNGMTEKGVEAVVARSNIGATSELSTPFMIVKASELQRELLANV